MGPSPAWISWKTSIQIHLAKSYLHMCVCVCVCVCVYVYVCVFGLWVWTCVPASCINTRHSLHIHDTCVVCLYIHAHHKTRERERERDVSLSMSLSRTKRTVKHNTERHSRTCPSTTTVSRVSVAGKKNRKGYFTVFFNRRSPKWSVWVPGPKINCRRGTVSR